MFFARVDFLFLAFHSDSIYFSVKIPRTWVFCTFIHTDKDGDSC